KRLNHLVFEWTNPENEDIRTRYPEVSNGATYALYVFFDYDQGKLQAWHDAYVKLFGDNFSQMLTNAFLQPGATTINLFLVRPFQHPEGSFYTVNSFFDHQYPLYTGEDDTVKNTLYRFDGKVLENAAFDPCDEYLGISCYSGHDAYDYNTPLGWPIQAAASGRVVNVLTDTNTVIVAHDNNLLTYYMHLDVVYVEEETDVEQGDAIGEAGNKGTGGVHLHFGIRYQDNVQKDIDPFGWWSSNPDPWSEYPTYGQVSTWLWKGDEAGDGYLTVDNQETQAQLFLKPETTPPDPPNIGWHRLVSGYQNEAWYTFMNKNTDTFAYWGIWGSTIEQPGEYVVQAYWPGDPDTSDTWYPATNARYTLYFSENGVLQETTLYGNQMTSANQFNPLCKVPYLDGICPEEQIAKFNFDVGATTVILSNVAGYDDTQHQRILFFDAIQWHLVPPAPTPTPTATLLPAQGITIPIIQGSDDGGINPTDPCYFSVTDNEVYLGACFNGEDITSGFRFQNVQIPRNANIESAYLNFTVDGTYTTPIQVQIYGEASSNPLTYTESSPPTNRLTMFQSALWNITDTWGLGEQRNTPDLSPIIQEIVNRSDWNPGQPISIIVKNAGSTDVRRVIGFERASFDPNLKPAQLVVTYNLNPTPTPTATLINSTPQPVFTPTSIPPTFTPIPPTPVPTDPPAEVPWICRVCGIGCPASAQRLTANGAGLYGTPTPYATTSTIEPSSLRIAEAVDLTTLLYRVRDEILSITPEGQRLTDLYYTYIPNIVQVLMAHPELSDQSLEMMNLFVPPLQALLDGNGDTTIITSEQVAGLQSFLNALVEYGDPELQDAILSELERRPLESMIDMTMNEAWRHVNGYQLEWLPPISNSNPYGAQQGSAIPVKFTVTDFEGNFVVDESLTLQILDSNGNVVVGPIQVSSNPNNGIKIQGNQYHYNFKTKDLLAGSYTLQVTYNSLDGALSESRSIILTKKK
ncbi:MAG: M23 family metallopeptidase, partial [Chloroflexi bacterium]|nr:M23 family metallopeptidase [Chloroflexota bacterium]